MGIFTYPAKQESATTGLRVVINSRLLSGWGPSDKRCSGNAHYSLSQIKPVFFFNILLYIFLAIKYLVDIFYCYYLLYYDNAYRH